MNIPILNWRGIFTPELLQREGIGTAIVKKALCHILWIVSHHPLPLLFEWSILWVISQSSLSHMVMWHYFSWARTATVGNQEGFYIEVYVCVCFWKIDFMIVFISTIEMDRISQSHPLNQRQKIVCSFIIHAFNEMTGEIPFKDKLSYFSLRIQTGDHKIMGYNGKFRLSFFFECCNLHSIFYPVCKGKGKTWGLLLILVL